MVMTGVMTVMVGGGALAYGNGDDGGDDDSDDDGVMMTHRKGSYCERSQHH